MSGDLKLGPLPNPLDCPLQLPIGERHQPPTADADHVVVMPPGVIALKSHDLTTNINPVNQLQLLELFQRPIDASPPNTRQPPINLQRRNRTTLAPQQLDHLQPRRPSAKPSLIEPCSRAVRPAHAEEPT